MLNKRKSALHSALIDIPKFTFKPRKKYLSKKKFLETQQILFHKILTQIIYNRNTLFKLESSFTILRWMMLHYTAGAPISTIQEISKAYYYIVEDTLSSQGLNLKENLSSEEITSKLTKEDIGENNNSSDRCLLPCYRTELKNINVPLITGFLDPNKDIIQKSVFVYCCWYKSIFDNDIVVLNALDTDILSTCLTRFIVEKHTNTSYKMLERIGDFYYLNLTKIGKASNSDYAADLIKHISSYLQNETSISKEYTIDFESMFSSHLEHRYYFIYEWMFDATMTNPIHDKDVDTPNYHKYFDYSLNFIR